MFLKNDIFLDVNTQKMERVLWIDEKRNTITTITLSINKLEINHCDLNFMKKQLDNQNIRILAEDPTHRYIGEISDAENNLLKNAWNIIQYVFSNLEEPEIYDKKKRSIILKEAMEKFGISKVTVYKYLRKFLQGGGQKKSLIPNLKKCGGKGQNKKLSDKKVGRTNSRAEIGIMLTGKTDINLVGKNVTAEDIDIFELTLRRRLTDGKFSIPKAYELMVSDYYSETINDDGNYYKRVIAANRIPTIGQFRYWIKKIISEKNMTLDLEEKRIGSKKYEGTKKGINSSTSHVTLYPGYQMEIDSTRPPFHLLNKFGNATIGAPVVYTIVDSYSKFITAVFITLYNPSKNTATATLINLLEDKVDYCKQNGINITYDDWPNAGLPRYLLADRGEFAGKFSDELVDELKIGINNTPSFSGRSKPNVEQGFNLIEEELFLLAGRIQSDYKERGVPDYRKKARLTIKDFTKAFIEVVLKLNNRYMKDFILSEEMIMDGVIKSPAEIFKWGLNKYPNIMRRRSGEYIKDNIMKHDKASVTRSGIKYAGRVYECEASKLDQWTSLARTKGSWKIEICYDERNMDTIYIIDVENNSTMECKLDPRYLDYKGMSLAEIIIDEMQNNSKRLEYQDTLNQKNLRLHEALRKIEKKANSDFKVLNKTGKVCVKNAGLRRKEEIEGNLVADDIDCDEIIVSLNQEMQASLGEKNNKMERFLKQRKEEK